LLIISVCEGLQTWVLYSL